ncbi:MAG: 2-oxoacid:ferredoxin oxidoreductase subunit beta [Chloroflexi bacterium]|nr:2-oxoacid:ferredoxin oxidoreductase subunit beta [Chloroflexota bacterium]MBI1854748.1 2-oxoacid:ferredoxin oxidoreductase subunit beta [Chloroflexota bacterium]MBI3339489.1 2-oxoacid:ferredoxin oxidoreductase subunit beta [Chloroflexota bacterium]
MAGTNVQVNLAGLAKNDYRGNPTTLCQGCGHNSISNQIVSALFEMNIVPENVIKFSGIGCSSKSPTYFMNRSFGFNSLHGRMPSIATGALFGDHHAKGLGVSGDGDTASIGMGQFKHIIRRNVNMVYIVENNGVYGLTKGQFSATSEVGLSLKHQGVNQYMPVDICMEGLASNATFVARSFAGNPKQVKELLKAALAHNGTALLDIISPCVTFNNQDNTFHSYAWGKDHEEPLHDITYIAPRNEIVLEREMDEGEVREVGLHDGSTVILKNLEKGYDPTNRFEALRVMEEARRNNWLITGLLYIDPTKPALTDTYNLTDTPLNRLTQADLRPAPDKIDLINSLMF